MLQGKIAGAVVVPTSGRPGDGVSIRVRGIGSIRGNVEPLWVIDGVVGASSADLNPNDIESISILKDGSATALYGSRGANGVLFGYDQVGSNESKTYDKCSCRRANVHAYTDSRTGRWCHLYENV